SPKPLVETPVEVRAPSLPRLSVRRKPRQHIAPLGVGKTLFLLSASERESSRKLTHVKQPRIVNPCVGDPRLLYLGAPLASLRSCHLRALLLGSDIASASSTFNLRLRHTLVRTRSPTLAFHRDP